MFIIILSILLQLPNYYQRALPPRLLKSYLFDTRYADDLDNNHLMISRL